jgi:hypothetical protein
MSNWITDRLPTAEDAQNGRVLAMFQTQIVTNLWESISDGDPWQKLPAPYVKPVRWTVEWSVDTWKLVDHRQERFYFVGHGELGTNDGEAAQRIADVLNEVMP